MLPSVPRLRRVLRTTLFGLFAPLAACSPTTLVNGFVPADGYDVIRDIAYGDHPRQRLDIYRPAEGGGSAPVVVFFYGGSWETGARESYLFVGEALASAGAVVVIPDYRLWPEVMFPAFVEDGAAAVAWVQANIRDHGGDPSRIAIAGHSAGAHIAAMVALAPDYLAAAGGEPEAIDALIGIAGPYDFLPSEDRTIQRIFAVDDPPSSQPVNVVRDDPPRTLLLHGRDDRTVLPRHSLLLRDALEEAGGRTELELYDGIGHIEIVGALAPPLRWLADTRADVVDFLGLRL